MCAWLTELNLRARALPLSLPTALALPRRFIASKFPMVTIEKYMGSGPPSDAGAAAGHEYGDGCCEEARQLEALAALKRARANLTTVLYLNSLLDFPNYALHKVKQKGGAAARPRGHSSPPWAMARPPPFVAPPPCVCVV